MSWAEDMGFDCWDFLDEINSNNEPDEDVWYSKSGPIFVKDMTDQHLLNAYLKTKKKMLLREMTVRMFKKHIAYMGD